MITSKSHAMYRRTGSVSLSYNTETILTTQHYIYSSGLNTVCFYITVIMILQCCGTQKSSNDLVDYW